MSNRKFPLAEHFVLKGYVDATVHRAGLTAKFTDDVTVPTTTGNQLLIPRPNSEMTEEDGKKLRHWVLHETLHHTEGADIFPIMQREQLDPSKDMIGKLLNAFEDTRIEKIGAARYTGDKQIINDGHELVLPRVIDAFKSIPEEGWQEKETKVLAAAVGLNILSRAGWSPASAMNAHGFMDALPKDVYQLVEGLANYNWVDRVDNLSSAEDSLELAKELWEEVTNEPPPPPSGGGGDNDSGDGDSGDEDKSSQEQSGQGDDKDDEGAESKAGGGKEGDTDGDQEMPGYLREIEFSHHERDDGGYQSSGLNITYPQADYGAYKFASLEDIYVADFVNNTANDPDIRSEMTTTDYHVKRARSDYDGLIAQHQPSRGFSNKVRQLLQVKSQAYYIGGQKKGKLNGSQLYRAGCPKQGDGDWNRTVYKKKIDSDMLDVAVFVLVDGSGSMGGPRYAHATESARMLNHTISKTLKIPTMIGVFTEADGTHGSDCVIGITKHFDRPVSDDVLLENMAKATIFMSVNPDGDALMWAYHALRQRKEKRKVLIVLSDGQPTGSRQGDTRKYTKEVAKKIEDQGLVDIAAIGIQSHAPENIYTDASFISEPAELEHALLDVIKRKIMV